jgi:hypothetical protein
VLCLAALAVAAGSSARLDHLVPWAVALIAATFFILLLPFNRLVASWIDAWVEKHASRRWPRSIQRFLVAYAAYGSRKRMLAAIGFASILESSSDPHPLILTRRRTSATLRMLIVAGFLSMFLARLPIAVSGIGVGEGSLVYFLGMFGVPAHEALALALAGTTLNIIVALPGLILWREVMRRDVPADSLPGEPPAGG